MRARRFRTPWRGTGDESAFSRAMRLSSAEWRDTHPDEYDIPDDGQKAAPDRGSVSWHHYKLICDDLDRLRDEVRALADEFDQTDRVVAGMIRATLDSTAAS